MTDRLTELEIKLSLTEDLVDELNRTVFRQQEQIDLLQAQLRVLYGQMQANAEPVEPRNLKDEIPPHY
jgi:SlyX protein